MSAGKSLLIVTVGLLAVVAVVILLTQWSHSSAEYTEEIERLRRDLIASREKNGIYVDEENYSLMQHKLTAQAEEIKERKEEIDALKEQIDKINELFNDTKNELQTRNSELEEKSQALVKTTSVLQHTHKALNKVTLERDEKSHLVVQQVQTEKKLSAQAQKLLEVADQSTTDVSALHMKLDRKRSVETVNDQRSREFRTSFQQKLGHMEDLMSQLVQKQSSYITTLHKDFSQSLEAYEKQYLELSGVIAALSNSHSQHLEILGNKMTEEGEKEQRWAEEILRIHTNQKNSAVSSHRMFVSEHFIPQIGVLNNLLKKQHLILQEQNKTIISSLEQQQASLKYYVAEHLELTSELWKNIKVLLEEQATGVRKVQDNVVSISEAESSLNQKWEDNMKMLQQMFSTMQEMMTRHKEHINPLLPQIQDDLRETSVSTQKCQGLIENHITQVKNSGNEFEETCIRDLQSLSHETQDSLKKAMDFGVEVQTKQEMLQTESVTAADNMENAWETTYQEVEARIREHAENHVHELQANRYHLQELSTVVQNSVVKEEETLENHRQQHEKQVNSHRHQLANLEGLSMDFVQSLTQELRLRDQDMDKFLNEDMLKDVPTGQTPQRREYSYPRVFAATSPHERILERFRNTLDVQKATELTVPDESDIEEIEESTKLSPEVIDVSSVTSETNLSIMSDESSISELSTDSSFVIKSEGDQMVKDNKENVLINPSTMSKKKHHGKSLRHIPVPSGRKPLRTPNSSL